VEVCIGVRIVMMCERVSQSGIRRRLRWELDGVYRGWRRPIGSFNVIGHFPQKSPIISSSFTKRVLHLKASNASSPHCAYRKTSKRYI